MDILQTARQEVRQETTNWPPARRVVRAAWRTQYLLRLTPNDFPVLREFLLLEVEGLGSCHCPSLSMEALDPSCIGEDALELKVPIEYEIAALDALASQMHAASFQTHTLSGGSREMLEHRTEIIVSEALRLMDSAPALSGGKVAVVGALGSLLAKLQSIPGLHVSATDEHPSVVGRDYHGTVIENSTKTVERVREADVAIVTGMTLVNGSINQLLELESESHVRILMFLQTGANIVSPFLTHGASVVVSEPYPFYFSGCSNSIIRVYRAGDSSGSPTDSLVR